MGELTIAEMRLLLLVYFLVVEKETFILMMLQLQRTYDLTSKDSTQKTLIIRQQVILIYPVSRSLGGDHEEYMRRGQVSQQEIMRFQAMRIKSFHNIQIQNSRIKLAKAGFYATGVGDEVRCFSCGKRQRNWERRDNPQDLQNHAPNCRHVRGLDTRNVPFTGNPLPYDWAFREIQRVVQQVAESGRSRRIEDDPLIRTRGALGVYQEVGVILKLPEAATTKESGSSPAGRQTAGGTPGLDLGEARHYNQRDIYTRIDSFQSSQHTDSLILAGAGFFFEGDKDCVRCFYCGIGLRNWSPYADPWVEHIRYSPRCTYVRAIAGEPFVQQTLANNVILNNTPARLTTQDLNDRLKELLRRKQEIKKILEERMNLDGDGIENNELLKIHWTEVDFRYRELLKTIARLNAALANPAQTQDVRMKYLREMDLRIKVLEESLSEVRKCINNSGREYLESLRKENEDLKNSRRCKVCLENEVTIVFLPCGHLVTCAHCAPALETCPVCRQPIRATARTCIHR